MNKKCRPMRLTETMYCCFQAAKKAKMDALRLPDDVLESIEDDADASDKEEAETTGPSHLLTSQTANRIAFDSGSEGEPDDDVDR